MNSKSITTIRRKLFLYNLGLLIVLGISSYFYYYKNNYYVAEAISENLHNDIAFEDHSVIIRKLSNLVPSNFSKIIVIFNNSDPVIIEENSNEISKQSYKYTNSLSQTEVYFFFDLTVFLKYFFMVSLIIMIFGYLLSKKYMVHIIEKLENEYEIKNALNIAELSHQVAHDIRSPLSALNMIIGTLHEFPSDKLQLITDVSERINEIANDLLQNSKKSMPSNHSNLNTLQNTHSEKAQIPQVSIKSDDISKLLETILNEKKAQYFDKKNIQFILDNQISHTILLKFDENQLLRVLSNIINNSVEALGSKSGEILISAREYSEVIQIIIIDNGPGIPEEILQRIGEKGFTTKKEGNGLGLSHANKTMESIGGKLSILSKSNFGTQISLQIPK